MPMHNFQKPLLRQRPIGLRNRVEVDSKIQSKLPHRRQRVPRTQHPFHHQRPQLAYYLPPRRYAAGGIKSDLG